jgi:tetratricopeptide (TPR) repeat protein
LNPKAIVVNNEIPKLHGGDTIFEFTATSADSTKKEKYVVVVRKEKISFRVHVQSESGIEATTILCKLCKMIPFCPRMSKGQQEFGYCLTCLKLLIDCNNKSSNFVVDPLPLKAVDNLSEVCLESNSQMESIIDGLLVKCPYSLFGCSLVCSNLLMATHANGCPYKLTKKEPDTSTCIDCGKLYVTAEKLFHNERCLSKNTAPRLTITKTNVSKWETALINIEKYKYTPDAALSKNNKDMEAYAYNLNQCYDHYKENEGNGTIRPNIDLLSDAMKTLATTIGSANSNNNNAAELHYQLGLLKEESDLVNLIFPLIEVSSVDDNLKNKEAGNSFMADEVDGLLMQLAVAPTASNISKLKALEGEYQRLKSNSQTNEATEVQGLYQWLLKKTNGTSDGSDAPKQEKVLQISTEKYKDCLLINPNHLEANIYLGRSLLFKGEFDEAQSFLAYAVAINPLHQLSKFYLAIQTIKAAFIKKSKHGLLEAITYLENYISSLSFGDHLIPSMITNDNLRRTNGFVVEGLFTLANGYKMQTKFKEAESVILDILYTIPTELISSPKKGESFRTLVRQFCQAQCDLHDLSFFIESRRSELLESNLIALIEIFEVYRILLF